MPSKQKTTTTKTTPPSSPTSTPTTPKTSSSLSSFTSSFSSLTSSMSKTLPPTKIIEFVLDENTLLGEGSYSEVRLAVNTSTNEYVAAKMTDLTKHRAYYDKEVRALTSIPAHPNIIPLVQYGEDGGTGYIFTEYTGETSETLMEYVERKGRLEEEESMGILEQLVDGLDVIHGARFAHNDLKPENVLYDSQKKTARIFDFGLSSELHQQQTHVTECCGSPLYMSPEVLTRSKTHNPFLSDIWSLGLILYYMLSGDLPWPGVKNFHELVRFVVSGVFQIPNHVTTEARELLNGMLHTSPRARWSLEMIKKKIRECLEKMMVRKNITRSLTANIYTRF